MSLPSSHWHRTDRLDPGVGPTSPDSKHRCAFSSSFVPRKGGISDSRPSQKTRRNGPPTIVAYAQDQKPRPQASFRALCLGKVRCSTLDSKGMVAGVV